MRWRTLIAMRLRMLFGRDKKSARLDEEMRFHLEAQIAENIAAGMSASEARTTALRTFGNPALLRDQTRATWSWATVESFLSDARFAVRTLRRSPGFSA